MYTARHFECTKFTPILAYLLGVYLGDGSILRCSDTSWKFCLDSIDKDFVEFVKTQCESIFGPLPSIKEYSYLGYTSKGVKYNRRTYFRFMFGSKDFCMWLVDITKNKKVLPLNLIKRTSITLKRFLEGYLDSEGWVSETKECNAGGYHRYTVGFATTELWCDEIAKLCQQVHIKPTGRRLGYSRIGTPFIQYSLSTHSFVTSGLRLHIKRKQDRLDRYRFQYMTPSETKRLPEKI